jgi:two-component system, sensor histidine kinase and response regulator
MNVKYKKHRVLIVDDVPVDIAILDEALSAEYEIVVVTNGKEALDIAGSKVPPDLILLDIMMPEMDGYEVCRRLKDDEKTQNIPVIFTTAKGEEEDETKGLKLGAVDYIAKPFSVSIVIARVKTHLNLKKKTDLLENLVSIDALTEIPNRRRYDSFFKQEWYRARRTKTPLSLVFIDVDFFKTFNDNYGHAAGDECISTVARVLKSSLQRATDFVARYGGDEFVAVLPDTDIAPALEIAEKMRTNLDDMNITHSYSEVSDRVTISVGVATTDPTDGLSQDSLIKAADSVLYEAKEQGRNCVKSIRV